MALVLGMARSPSVPDMAVQFSALLRAIRERGDPDLEEFVAEMAETALRLRNYPQELMEGGAKTMEDVADRFQRSMDELVQKGRAEVLGRLAVRRFGEATASELAGLLEGVSGPDGIDRVTAALLECGTREEFIERVRTV